MRFEQLAFYAKDALIVIDDFAPQGNIAEVSRYHAAADRIFRAAGNHSGAYPARLQSQSARIEAPARIGPVDR